MSIHTQWFHKDVSGTQNKAQVWRAMACHIDAPVIRSVSVDISGYTEAVEVDLTYGPRGEWRDYSRTTVSVLVTGRGNDRNRILNWGLRMIARVADKEGITS